MYAVLVNNFNVLYENTLTDDEKVELKEILSLTNEEINSKITVMKEEINNKVDGLLNETSNDQDKTFY